MMEFRNRNIYKTGIFILMVFVITIGQGFGQCRLDTNVLIRKTDTVDFIIPVRDILNNDLLDSGQGLCRIDLSLDHEYVGDLLIWLRSPAGQEIQLTGPEVMSGWTAFQKWDISFVRMADIAAPDPGFSAKWSNAQTWGIGGAASYTGSYYPFKGNLEDFNTGPVNGDWVLHIEDRTRFYGGHIKGLQLIFCDDIGPECAPCQPNEFRLEEADMLACEGEESLLVFPAFSLSSSSKDSARYDSRLFLVYRDTIRNAGLGFDLRNAPPGKYMICGVSYLKNHMDLLPKIGENWREWVHLWSVDSAGLCASLSDRCMEIEITAIPDTTFIEDLFCRGGTYIWQDTVIDDPGTFIKHLRTRNSGCDSIVVLTLDTVNLRTEIEVPDTLSCARQQVTLRSHIHAGAGNLILKWQTDTGHILTPDTDSVAIVDQPGEYRLIVHAGQCADTLLVIVPIDVEVPGVQLSNDTLDCDRAMVCLKPVLKGKITNFEWRDANHALLSKDTPFCTMDTGFYTLTVFSQNACSASKTIHLMGDFDVPVPIVRTEQITCSRDSAILSLENSGDYRSWTWFDNNGQGLSTGDSQIVIRTGGDYSIELIGKNGCLTSRLFSVEDLRHVPMPVFDIRPLSCKDSFSILKSGLDSTPPAMFSWVAPGGMIINTPMPKVREPGTYRLHYVDTAGCVLDTAVELRIDTLSPDLSFMVDTIRCEAPEVTIRPLGNTAGLRVKWTGPDNFASNEWSPVVSEAGNYQALLTGANGCTKRVSVEVLGDTLIPDLRLESSATAFDCIHKDSIRLRAISSRSMLSYRWYGLINSSDTNTVLVRRPGNYKVEITTSNNCRKTDSIYIGIDTVLPVFRIIPGDTINCQNRSSQWVVVHLDSLAMIDWRLNGITISNEDTLKTKQGGLLEMRISGSNGCVDSLLLDIPVDTLAPVLVALDDTLTCRKTNVRIQFQGDTGKIADLRWVNSNGTELKGRNPVVTQGGVYYLEIEGDNACFSYDSAIIYMDTLPPSVSVQTDTLTCNKKTVRLIADIGGDYDSLYWKNSGIPGSSDSFLTVRSAGRYVIVVLGENGCEDSAVAIVPVDTTAPVVDLLLLDTLDCNHSAAKVLLRKNLEDTAKWSTMYGKILTLIGDSIAEFTDSATVTVVLTNVRNGCVASKTLRVKDQRIPPEKVLFSIADPLCAGETSGAIEIDSIIGNYPPYTLLVDGELLRGRRRESLPSGPHTIRISGRNGCVLDTAATLSNPLPLSVFAGQDTSILLGGKAILHGKVVKDPEDEISSVEWMPDYNLSCPSCLRSEAMPRRTTEYRLTVMTDKGCVATDDVLVTVIKGSGFYLPNTFTPNGDQINDVWKVFFPIHTVHSFHISIYDRWGGHMIDSEQLPNNQEAILWDGTFNGRACNPGVYIYRLIIRYVDGSYKYVNGDITLVK